MIQIASEKKNPITGEPISLGSIFSRYQHTFHVGEITRLERLEYSPEPYDGINFCDDKGVMFSVTARPLVARHEGFVPIHMNPDRSDLLPEEYKGLSQLTCSDPRVVWIGILRPWLRLPDSLYELVVKGRDVWYEAMNDLLPSYDEAVELLKKNGFPPFISDAETMRKLRNGPNSEYYSDWGALKFPPKVDWSKYI